MQNISQNVKQNTENISISVFFDKHLSNKVFIFTFNKTSQLFDTVAQNIKKTIQNTKKIESSAIKTRRKSHPTTHSAIDHEKSPLAKVSQSTFNGKIILFAQRKERSFRFSKRKSEKNLIS